MRGRRARELGARHEAVRAMRDGATFVDVVARAMRDHGLGANVAVSIAERAFRGGDGVRAGLGREAVYLPAFLRVKAHLSAHPDDETVLSSGQVAVAAVHELRPLVRR